MFDREAPHSTQHQLDFLTGQLTTEFLGGTTAGGVTAPGCSITPATGTVCCVSRSGLCTAGCVV